MGIYTRARIKITVITIASILGVIIGIWAILFTTDYIMFKNGYPLLFAITKVEEIEDKHIITESGLGYYVIQNEQDTPKLYLFGRKVK